MVTASLAPAPRDLRQLKTIDHESMLAAAVVGRPLSVTGEAGLKNALKYVFSLVGLRKLPTDAEKLFLHQYILKNYQGHSDAEIQLAFDMAVQGQLDIDYRDVQCYENFSAAYFANIMRAYRKWANEEARRLEQISTPAIKPTPNQLADISMDYACYLFKFINKKPCDYEWIKGQDDQRRISEVLEKKGSGEG